MAELSTFIFFQPRIFGFNFTLQPAVSIAGRIDEGDGSDLSEAGKFPDSGITSGKKVVVRLD
jgi:hypothetical protein